MNIRFQRKQLLPSQLVRCPERAAFISSGSEPGQLVNCLAHSWSDQPLIPKFEDTVMAARTVRCPILKKLRWSLSGVDWTTDLIVLL